MAKNTKKEPTLAEEAGLGPEWKVVDQEPIIPSAPSLPLPPSPMGNYYGGSISSSMQHDGNFVNTKYGTRDIPVLPLMPVTLAGTPAAVSAIQSVVISSVTPPTPAPTPGSGNMTFRGQWNSTTSYNVDDVVLDNISCYIAIIANTNSEPDQGSVNWSLLGKNLNFRGQWLASTAPSTAVHIQSGQVGGVTGPTSVVFGSNNTAGNTIVVFATAGHNFASGNPDPGYGFSISDTQGNVYTQVGAASAFNAANGWKDTAVYIAANVKAGPNTVTATVVGGSPSPPQTTGIVAAEYAGNPTVTPLTYESQNSVSGGTISSISTPVATGQPNQVVLIFSGTTINSGAETVTPAGFTGRQAQLYDKTIALASGVTYSLNYSGAASGGIIFGLALTNVASSSYFPFDTVIYQGSTYVCIKAALSSQAPTNTTYWILLSQGTGGVNALAANYTAVSLDDGQLISNSTASTFTVKLPAVPPYLGWWVAFQNSGVGTIIVNPNGPNLDGSASNFTLNQNQGMLVFTDGVNYFTERGIGTVASVGLSLPNIFAVTGSPVTGSGTLTATLVNETANTVFAGPSSGAAATPTFRALVAADMSVGGVNSQSGTTYTAVAGDYTKLISFSSGSATTLTLPAVPPSSIWWILVQAVGAGGVTVSRNGLLIDGAASNVSLPQNQGVIIYTDGTNYFTERGMSSAAGSNAGGVNAQTANYTAVTGDTGKLISMSNAGAFTLTLPAAAPSATWWIAVENTGAGTLTVSRNGLNIDGAASNFNLTTAQGVLIFADGTNYFTSRGMGSGGGGGAPTTSLYVLGAADGSLPNAAVNPTAFYGVDVAPVSAGSLDDEFNGSSLSGSWTQVNFTGSAAVAVSKSLLSFTADGVADKNAAIVQTAPSTPWTVITKITAASPVITTNYRAGGIIVIASGATTTSKCILFRFKWGNSGTINFGQDNFTNITTYSSTPNSVNAGAGTGPTIWLQLANDGTTFTFSYSVDGVNYWTLWTYLVATFTGTIGNVGLTVAATSTAPTIYSFDYFRRTV